MKASVRIMSTITTVWTLLVFLVVILMVLPVVPGVVDIRLPSPEDWVTSINNDTVELSSNMSVRNGGLFPFNDFYFVLELYGTNGSVLAKFSSDRTDLQVNRWTQIPLSFEINRTNIDNNRLRDILFQKVTFGNLLFFNVRYLLDFRAQLGANGSITLGPLIDQELHLDRSFLSTEGGNGTWNIPYSLNTSAVLYGRNISLSGTVRNGTEELGRFNETISLGTNSTGNLTIDLAQNAYQHLTTSSDRLQVNVTIAIGELIWSYQTERDWQPPKGG